MEMNLPDSEELLPGIDRKEEEDCINRVFKCGLQPDTVFLNCGGQSDKCTIYHETMAVMEEMVDSHS